MPGSEGRVQCAVCNLKATWESVWDGKVIHSVCGSKGGWLVRCPCMLKGSGLNQGRWQSKREGKRVCVWAGNRGIELKKVREEGHETVGKWNCKRV